MPAREAPFARAFVAWVAEWQRAGLSGTQERVLLMLCSRMEPDGAGGFTSWYPRGEMAERLGVPPQTVSNAVRALTRRGFLAVAARARRGARSTVYRVMPCHGSVTRGAQPTEGVTYPQGTTKAVTYPRGTTDQEGVGYPQGTTDKVTYPQGTTDHGGIGYPPGTTDPVGYPSGTTDQGEMGEITYSFSYPQSTTPKNIGRLNAAPKEAHSMADLFAMREGGDLPDYDA